MNSREVSVWLDSRWCDALEKHKGAPMCDIVNDYLDSLINQLPEASPQLPDIVPLPLLSSGPF